MSLPISLAARIAARRATVSRSAAASQRVAFVPLSTGSDYLPKEYDRDAVQVALDGIVARIYEDAMQRKAVPDAS